ncbi:hypothetical protein GCM10007971_06070 [Oceanobacillus indicireducens]|uniref:Uncharacterized protein n=1 Tax=Oceanobacillus indicireducens TaxID=1004261 RepID=A0A917XSR0_9BACI|nr:hypothetical protein GCM10007971_06070 [Oceanobacillus indicireducens]
MHLAQLNESFKARSFGWALGDDVRTIGTSGLPATPDLCEYQDHVPLFSSSIFKY